MPHHHAPEVDQRLKYLGFGTSPVHTHNDSFPSAAYTLSLTLLGQIKNFILNIGQLLLQLVLGGHNGGGVLSLSLPGVGSTPHRSVEDFATPTHQLMSNVRRDHICQDPDNITTDKNM